MTLPSLHRLIPSSAIFALCLSPLLNAELIPASQTAPWEDAGLPNGIPNYSVGVNVLNYGAVGNGVADDTQAIQDAIDACPAERAVYLPNGTYRLTDTLTIPSEVVLRGESRLGTTLAMDHSDDGIFIGTYLSSSAEKTVTAGLAKGSTVVTLSSVDTSKFLPGRIVELKQDNDPNVYQIGYKGYESWTDRQTGMTNEIVSVSGNQVTLKHPIFLEFSTAFNPKMRAQARIYRAGVESLTIDRILDDSQGTGNNVYFYAAQECWVKDIWSEKTYAHHIRLARSLQCEVRGNIANDTWLDNGGQGYGFVVQDRSTLNLVEDNSGNHLRHSYVVQSGASGNVFGYNFSSDPYSDVCPSCIFSDLSAHGSMANYTLWEGNKVTQIYLDNVHGSNPWNAAFRNYATKPDSGYAGIDIAETSKWCSLIGNVAGNTASSGQAIEVDSAVESTTIVTGNLNGFSGVTEWDTAYHTTLPDSLYLSTKPAFMGSKPWPIYGPEVGEASTLPAQDRWYSLAGITPPVEAEVLTTPAGDFEALLDPVLYYNCDDGSGFVLTDLTQNFINGVIDGASFNTDSHDDTGSLAFDGVNDEVVVGDQAALDIEDAITIAAWVRTDDATKNQCILSKNSAYYVYLYGGSSGARVRVGLRINGSWQQFTTSSSNTVAEDTWTHVAVTYDGSTIQVYLDGQASGSGTQTGTIGKSSKDIELGTLWNGYRLQGDLDDVTLFDTALDSDDIDLLYTGDWLSPIVPESMSSYDFEEGTGTLANDGGIHELDGTISGAIYSSDRVAGSYSLQFDGVDDEVTIDDAAPLDIDTAITLAAWIKSFDENSHQCIIGKNSAYYLQLYAGSNGLRARCGFRINGSWVTLTSSSASADSIDENTWAHVATTYDGNAIYIYIDGEEVGSKTVTGPISSSNKDLELGTIWNGYRFDGLMDEVKIYDFALFADEVEILAAAQ